MAGEEEVNEEEVNKSKPRIPRSQPGPGSKGPAEAPSARELGLRHVATDMLTIRRVRCGKGFSYIAPDGTLIRDPRIRRRLSSLAVPPAYEGVYYAADPSAHLQAVGRDAAGRLQYRYHPKWERIRERRKAQRLLRLADTLPVIRRAVTRHLASEEPTREFALAAAVELVAATAIRSGSEEYARKAQTRGAATLLKSNVGALGETVTLSFRAKGGKTFAKEIYSPHLSAAIAKLRNIPGRRLFQYRDELEQVRIVHAPDINRYLRSVAGVQISLKDFRTLCASALVLDQLLRVKPATSQSQRKRQVLEAVRQAAANLANTPAICRRSYVHDSIVTAFENGVLERLSLSLSENRASPAPERLVAEVIAEHER